MKRWRKRKEQGLYFEENLLVNYFSMGREKTDKNQGPGEYHLYSRCSKSPGVYMRWWSICFRVELLQSMAHMLERGLCTPYAFRQSGKGHVGAFIIKAENRMQDSEMTRSQKPNLIIKLLRVDI